MARSINNGWMLMANGAVRKSWTEYFEELLNVENVHIIDVDVVRTPVLGARNGASINKDDVQGAVNLMKAGKAPGLDGILAECLRE